MKTLLLLTALVLVQVPAQKLKPLSITMDDFNYPYAVKFFPLVVEEQSVIMAYMDVPAAENPNGQTVVLMHGKNFGSYYWKNTIQHLSAQGYRVIAIDQLGFGKSSKADIHYSFHLLANNTRRLLQSIAVKKFVLVGHSTGGMLAARYALLYPTDVSQLVLEDPIGLEDYRLIVPYNTVDQLYQEEVNMPDSTTDKYIKAYFVNWKSEYAVYAEVLNRWKRNTNYAAIAKCAALTTQMIYEQPVCYEFDKLKMPAKIIVGEQDRTVPGKAKIPANLLPAAGQFPTLAQKAAQAMPNGQVSVINNTGHIPHIESETAFHKALDDFLASAK